jgi:hypothetical protein
VTFDPAQDATRLRQQLDAMRILMADGRWRTLAEIAARVHAPEASVSARLRDLRKPRFGFWTVLRERVDGGRGLHRYRAIRSEWDR